MAKKLEEIKEEECPYELPDGWNWERLGNVADVKGGKRLPKGHCLIEEKTKHPYIRVADFGIDTVNLDNIKYIKEDTFSQISRYIINKSDMYISIAGTIGKVGIIPNCLDGANLTENAAKICNINECTSAKYLMNLFKTDDIKLQINSNTKTTTQAKLALFRIENILLPLPPKEIQEKIVDNIDALFAKLDKAQEKVEQVLEASENRRAAILYDAFSGKLTEKWREENNISFDSWKSDNLQNICTMKITDGTHKTPTYCDKEEGVPFISSKDVVSGKICWDNIKYITEDLHEELYKRLSPQKNDVLLAKNGTTGVAAIVEDNRIFDIYVTLAVLRPNVDIIIPNYLLQIVNSPICKQQFNANLTGIGVPNLHLRDIKEVTIPLPSMPEQKEIVRLLDKFLSAEDKVKATCQSTLEAIATMRKSVLAKTFRGELIS